MQNNFVERILTSGLTYQEFVQHVEEIAATPISESEDVTIKEKLGYYPLNLRRMKRIYTMFTPSEEAEMAFSAINEAQTWMILSEGWCGDTAQNVPIIVKLAELNNNIVVRVVLRDSNPDLMDKYVTNGTRSIPKLIALDSDGKELFTWGARPEQIASVMKELIASGMPQHEREEKLHSWYAKDGGKSTASEITDLVRQKAFQTTEQV